MHKWVCLHKSYKARKCSEQGQFLEGILAESTAGRRADSKGDRTDKLYEGQRFLQVPVHAVPKIH